MRVWFCVAGSAWAIAVVAVSIITVIAPQRDGWLALAEVGMPFLFVSVLPFVLPALLSVPSAAGRHARGWRAVLRVSLVIAVAVAVIRFGPVWFSMPPGDVTGATVGVTSWNLETGQADPTAVVQEIRDVSTGVVGLVELARRDADPIRADAQIRARFPYQLLFPRDDSLGMGLLSSYPIVESGRIADDPPVVWARLDLGGGQMLHVVVAHPLPASWHNLGPLPIPMDYDPTIRDGQIRTLRRTVDLLLAGGQPLILAGDFNVTDREPAYADLAAGLRDAQLDVGLGPGSTWRPDEMKWLPLGIVRIDMAFGGNGVRPVSMTVDCTPRGSDHCLVRASMALP